jgi:hypothetical protein
MVVLLLLFVDRQLRLTASRSIGLKPGAAVRILSAKELSEG